MEPVGELRSADGVWAAVFYAKAEGTFDFRLFELGADNASWVEVAGQSDSAFVTQKEAISVARARYPQLAGVSYRIKPPDESPESTQSVRIRGRFLLFAAVAIVAGVSLLVLGTFWAGIALLSIGCLSLGWSIGGYGGVGYGGSNS
jgi:hypothetical protein